MSELANFFSDKGNEVHLVLLAESEDFYTVNDSVVIHRLGFENKGAIRKVLSELAVFIKFRRLLKACNPDAVLSFMDKYNVFTIMVSALLGVKVFISDRSNPNIQLQPMMRRLKKITYPHADGVVAQTSLAKSALLRLVHNDNVRVLPNPVTCVQRYPEIPREKLILNVGRLVPEKGQQYLLDAFARLKDADWKLVILGDGPLRGELETRIHELGIGDRVSLPGAVNDVDRWLARASIFAFSSVSEGFPNALVEAMAAGLPCVSFDCDAGPRDIIEHGKNGFLIEEGDVEAFSAALEQLVEDNDLASRIGENAMQARDTYNIESVGQRYFDFMLGR